MGIRSDGSIRSSDEVSLMEMEQRDRQVQECRANYFINRRSSIIKP